MQEPVHEAKDAGVLECLEILSRRSRLILTATLLAAAVSLSVSLILPKSYSATAVVLPALPDQGLMGMVLGQAGGVLSSSLAGDVLGAGSPADMYLSILGCNVISDAIIDRFKLMEVYDRQTRIDTYKMLEKRVSFSAGKKDGIISIVVEDRDPRRAAQMANAYVEELGAVMLRMSTTGAAQNFYFYKDKLAQASVELGQAEEALKRFQATHKLLDLTDQAKASVTGVAQLRAQLATQEVELETLRGKYTDATAEVKALRNSVEKIRGQIAALEGNGAASSIPAIGSVPALGQEYVRLLREFKSREAVFEALTKQMEISRLAEAKDVSPLQVVQKARVPDKKSKPKRALLVLASTFAAFLSAVAYVFLQEYFRQLPEERRRRWRGVMRRILCQEVTHDCPG